MTEKKTIAFEHEPSVAGFAISKSAYLDARLDASFKYIATSVLVLNTRSTSEPRILLAQRAASDSNPNLWEPPGGAVDDDDASILHAAVRELWEETGLRASWIGGPIGNASFFTRRRGGQVCQFSFEVRVEGGGASDLSVRLDPNEHQRFVWASKEEVQMKTVDGVKLEFTSEDVERTALLAFDRERDGSAT